MRFFYYVLLANIFFSCSMHAVSPEELNDYVMDEDNGLKKTVVYNGAQMSVVYRPKDLLVYQETEGQPVDSTRINDLRRRFNANIYFVLKLSRNNREALHHVGREQYGQFLEVLSFKMSEYVTMTTSSNDTIPVADFFLNRTFGGSSSTDLLFVFDESKALDDHWIQLNIKEFGMGVGNQKFRFKRQDIDRLPNLTLFNNR